MYSGLEGVTFQKGWMAKAVGTPTSGGKSFEYFVVGEEREGPADSLQHYWRNHVKVEKVAGAVGVGSFLNNGQWEYLRIDMNNAHSHVSGCFHYHRVIKEGIASWYCLETGGYDEVITAAFLCKVYQNRGGDCRGVSPITRKSYNEVLHCLMTENDKKALECMKAVSSKIGISVAQMRRVHIEKKGPYKRSREGKQKINNNVVKRRLVELDGKKRWIYRDGELVDVNWAGDKVWWFPFSCNVMCV